MFLKIYFIYMQYIVVSIRNGKAVCFLRVGKNTPINKLDIYVTVHHGITYEIDQQDATV